MGRLGHGCVRAAGSLQRLFRQRRAFAYGRHAAVPRRHRQEKTALKGDVYEGAEHRSIKLKKIKTFSVPFYTERAILAKHKVTAYTGRCDNTDYIFLSNDRFFSINPHKFNPSAQDGCYVLNEHGVNEVERFAFFPKPFMNLSKTSAAEN